MSTLGASGNLAPVEGDDPKLPGGAPANRTIQIDALTDVELVDSHGDEPEEDPLPSRAPPPLPRKQAASPMRTVGLTLLAITAGAMFALAVVHFVFPSPPPPVAAASPTTPASAPEPVAPAPRAMRQLRLDDEFVIRSSEPGSERE